MLSISLCQTAPYIQVNEIGPTSMPATKLKCGLRDRRSQSLQLSVKRSKLTWFGHVIRHNTLSKTILQGTLKGGRRRDGQQKSWTEDVKHWTDGLHMPQLLTRAEDRPAGEECLSCRPSCTATTPLLKIMLHLRVTLAISPQVCLRQPITAICNSRTTP